MAEIIPNTLDEIESLPREFLTCRQISKVLSADPHKLHLQAMTDPSKLGFPVVVFGTRVKIPKKPFLDMMRGAR